MSRLLFQSGMDTKQGDLCLWVGGFTILILIFRKSQNFRAVLTSIKSLSYFPYLPAMNTTLPYFSDLAHGLSQNHVFCAFLCLFLSKQQQQPLHNCASSSPFSKFSLRRAQWWAVWWHALNSSVMTRRFNMQTNNSPTDTKRKSCAGTVVPSVSCPSLVWDKHHSYLHGTVKPGTSCQKKHTNKKILFRMYELCVSNK